ncbi:hypothetical protein L2E82_42113 [Cichorium intybus]|uniref:Uncharacterized protein n=1 Tax=Cichorium intybus TaxID=13427 RepID=A0ACB8ZLD3_CICIN|nr:hypothetical protein L2E82_42113 [Cichorium intybus]
MVLQTQRCPGAPAQHHQESSGRIQGGGNSNFSAISGQTTPYSNYSQSHGHNGYENGPSYGYQKHSWTLKKLDVE